MGWPWRSVGAFKSLAFRGTRRRLIFFSFIPPSGSGILIYRPTLANWLLPISRSRGRARRALTKRVDYKSLQYILAFFCRQGYEFKIMANEPLVRLYGWCGGGDRDGGRTLLLWRKQWGGGGGGWGWGSRKGEKGLLQLLGRKEELHRVRHYHLRRGRSLQAHPRHCRFNLGPT